MNNIERRVLALSVIALTLILSMTFLSAYIRLASSSIGCSPWPDCQASNYAIDPEPGITITADDENRGLRLLHRLMASTFAVVATLLMLSSLLYRQQIHIRPTLATVCFALTILLALVGINTPNILLPAVTLANLTGGMLTTAIVWLLVLRLRNPPGNAPMTTRRWLNLANIWLVTIVIASGAWVSGNFAAGTCTGFLDCGPLSVEQMGNAFNIRTELTESDGRLLLSDVRLSIEWGHHFLAILLCISLIVSATLNHKNTRKTVISILTITVGLIALGILEEPTLLSAWIHNFWSLLLLLAVVCQYASSQD